MDLPGFEPQQQKHVHFNIIFEVARVKIVDWSVGRHFSSEICRFKFRDWAQSASAIGSGRLQSEQPSAFQPSNSPLHSQPDCHSFNTHTTHSSHLSDPTRHKATEQSRAEEQPQLAPPLSINQASTSSVKQQQAAASDSPPLIEIFPHDRSSWRASRNGMKELDSETEASRMIRRSAMRSAAAT